jgi:two-component system cell cycle sensor histidine kinase/response regulator CckA
VLQREHPFFRLVSNTVLLFCQGQYHFITRTEVQLPQGNGRVILVVDDEEGIRNITKSVLEASGYKVFLASNGNEAVKVFSEHLNEIALVLTDMVMPEMDGISAVSAIRELNHDIKTIAVTAHVESAEYVDLLGEVDAVVRKPYDIDMLLQTIDRLLAETSGAESTS